MCEIINLVTELGPSILCLALVITIYNGEKKLSKQRVKHHKEMMERQRELTNIAIARNNREEKQFYKNYPEEEK